MTRSPEGKLEGVTEEQVRRACLLVAEHYHGKRGVWAYNLYTAINDAFFQGELPWPHISWALTPHGACLGYAATTGRPPVIVLHPSVLGGTQKENPWGYPPSWLGERFAFDLLLHEAIHVSVEHRLGGWKDKGKTSHNNAPWVAEVNRLAPLLGLDGVQAGQSKLARVPIEDAPRTKRGKLPTRVQRVTDGNVPYAAVATFPRGVRIHLGLADDFYRAGVLPVGPE
jgi:hypothetical protein